MKKRNESLFITTISVLDMSLLMIKFFANLQKINKIPIYSACIITQNVLPQIVAWQVYWLIVVVTIERYIAVAKPLEVSILMSKKRCKTIIITLFIIFTILSSTQGVCLKYNEKRPHYCALKEMIVFKNSTDQVDICMIYMKHVFPYIKSALMSWIPALIFNILILISLKKSKKLRDGITVSNGIKRNQNMSPKTSKNDNLQLNMNKKGNIINRLKAYKQELKEKQITITLCTISFTFILFTAPFTIFEVIRKASHDKNLIQFLNSRDMHRLGHFLLDCLHVTNFIFYCVIARGFRSELKNIFLNNIWYCEKKNGSQGSHQTARSFL
jgi:hypothetical protein